MTKHAKHKGTKRSSVDPTPRNKIQSILYLVSVTLSGAAIMMLEVLGTRIIGAFYGIGIYVWASLISVTLICLAVGYFLGGKVADQLTTVKLYHILVASAVSVALIPISCKVALEASNSLGLMLGTLIGAFSIFALPLLLLAMVSPMVIKQNTLSFSAIGQSAGLVFSPGTGGSVVGTLVLAFVLLPFMGTNSLLVLIAVFLFAMAISIVLVDRQSSKSRIKTTIAIFFVASASLSFALSSPNNEIGKEYKIIAEVENIKGRLRVIDDNSNSVRWMLSNASVISGQPRGTIRSVFDYLEILEILPHLKPAAKEAMVIGLGAGALPMAFSRHGIKSDTIEIDPFVLKLAKDYFGFKPSGHSYIGDARYVVKTIDKKYDIVVHDCFTNGIVPAHILTLEMFRDLRALLKDDGLFVLSYFGYSHGKHAQAVEMIYATILSAFPHVHRLVPAITAEPIDNVFIASAKKSFLTDNSTKMPGRLSALRNKLLHLEKELALAPSNTILTDNYNPIEYLQLRKAEMYREKLFSTFGIELFI